MFRFSLPGPIMVRWPLRGGRAFASAMVPLVPIVIVSALASPVLPFPQREFGLLTYYLAVPSSWFCKIILLILITDDFKPLK